MKAAPKPIPAQSGSAARVLPVFLVFLTMGFGDAVNPLVGLAREQFGLSNFAAQLSPFAMPLISLMYIMWISCRPPRNDLSK